MAEEGNSAERSGNRTDAASIIAELWAEREQARSAGSSATVRPGGAGPGAPGPAAPRARADGRQRALAAAICVLLGGAGLGVVAQNLGFIGAPSKASFVAAADAACVADKGGFDGISKPVGYPSLATAASTLVTTTDAQLRKLRALTLPGGADRARARAVFGAITAANDAGRNLHVAAAAHDAAATAAASQSLSLYAQDAAAKARGYGFTACVAGMQPGIDAVVAGGKSVVKESFISAGNRLCGAFLDKLETIGDPRNANDVTRFVNEGAALVDKLVGDLRALPVPPGDEAVVAEMTTMMGDLGGKMKQLGAATVARDLKRVRAVEKEGDALADAVDAKFSAYGMVGCGG